MVDLDKIKVILQRKDALVLSI